MFLIALIATLVAFIQNIVMLVFGMKEQAIYSFPLSFGGIFLLEVLSIWAGYFCARKFLHKRRTLAVAAWVVITLGTAELALPASFFSLLIQHAKREWVLNQIKPVGNSIEPLTSDLGGRRFALTYTLKFPKQAHYLTFPAYLGPPDNRVFGNYFRKLHPEYYKDSYSFDAGKPYSFTVVFDTEGKRFDFSQEKANIDLCDGTDYFMACRIIGIGLEGVPAALAANPSPGRLEPAVSEDNVWDITEKSIRLDALRLESPKNKSGPPVRFSFVITNVGKKDVAIPEGKLADVININYGWEPVSESAKATKATTMNMPFAKTAVSAGGWFTSGSVSMLRPGEQLPVEDKIMQFEPFAPGDYRVHLYLFSRYSTETNRPVQELLGDFTIVP